MPQPPKSSTCHAVIHGRWEISITTCNTTKRLLSTISTLKTLKKQTGQPQRKRPKIVVKAIKGVTL
eukprot:scaffold738_cov340-Pavlova_lutheri.AAC.20